MTKEITIEITDYCPHECKYCSSDAKNYAIRRDAMYLDYDTILRFLFDNGDFYYEGEKLYDVINISGGEPLSHPGFWRILQACKKLAKDVVIYSNAITHIRYNANVIDGIYVEANLTIPDSTKKVHLLKRVKQGREKTRPEVHFSRNFTEDCSCDHRILRPDGSVTRSPCDKWSSVDEESPLTKEDLDFIETLNPVKQALGLYKKKDDDLCQ